MRVRFSIEYDCCRYGISYTKLTALATNCVALESLSLECEFNGPREILQGKVKLLAQDGRPEWKWKTSFAAAHPPSLRRSRRMPWWLWLHRVACLFGGHAPPGGDSLGPRNWVGPQLTAQGGRLPLRHGPPLWQS